ncbi:hypothetical protein [Pseudanabaena sp. FACHB-2040]|nr:hypothetical protein [Pseudanabaena sp. FACHB-2040]
MAHDSQVQRRTASAAQVQDGEVDFDQWAKAVRQQMIEALKRRGN